WGGSGPPRAPGRTPCPPRRSAATPNQRLDRRDGELGVLAAASTEIGANEDRRRLGLSQRGYPGWLHVVLRVDRRMEPEGAFSLKDGCLPEQPAHRIELLSRSRFAAQMAFPPPKGQLGNC